MEHEIELQKTHAYFLNFHACMWLKTLTLVILMGYYLLSKKKGRFMLHNHNITPFLRLLCRWCVCVDGGGCSIIEEFFFSSPIALNTR